jgi:hypothetical protein
MREIKRVVETRAVDHGHAIEVELEYRDGSIETIKCPFERAGMLVHGITNATVVAERMRSTQPKQKISLEVTYDVTEVHTGPSVDGKKIALRFQTTLGSPAILAMSLDLARRTIERITAELEKVRKQPPSRLS